MTMLFQDTFTGSGDLGSHTPDVGGAYSKDTTGFIMGSGSSGAANVSDLLLNGSGALEFSTSTDPALIVQADANDICGTTAVFEVGYTISGSGDGCELWVTFRAASPGTDSARIHVTNVGATNTLAVSVSDVLFGGDNTTEACGTGSHVVRIESSPTGTVLKLDAITVWTSTFFVGALCDRVGFWAQRFGADTGTIDYISMDGDSLLPGPPDGFWRHYVKTSEVVS